MEFPIGFKYKDRHGKNCEVVDYLITRTVNGNVWKERYLVRRTLCGQVVMDDNVVETSIKIAVALQNKL